MSFDCCLCSWLIFGMGFHVLLEHPNIHQQQRKNMTESSVVVDNTSFNELNLPYDRCEKLFLYGDSAYMEERYNDAVQLYTSSIHEMAVTVETASTRRDGVKKFLSSQSKFYKSRDGLKWRTVRCNCT